MSPLCVLLGAGANVLIRSRGGAGGDERAEARGRVRDMDLPLGRRADSFPVEIPHAIRMWNFRDHEIAPRRPTVCWRARRSSCIIDDMDLLRHGAMTRAVRRHPGAVHAGLAPALLYLGQRQPAGEGGPGVPRGAGAGGAAAARRGHAGVHRYRLDAETRLRPPEAGREVRPYEDPGQVAAGAGAERAGRDISTPLAAPVIAATRLRGGNAASARGAASLAAQAISTARDCGCTGTIMVRMDSAYLQRRGDRRGPPRRRAVLGHRSR